MATHAITLTLFAPGNIVSRSLTRSRAFPALDKLKIKCDIFTGVSTILKLIWRFVDNAICQKLFYSYWQAASDVHIRSGLERLAL